jgi:hypothetical protein
MKTDDLVFLSGIHFQYIGKELGIYLVEQTQLGFLLRISQGHK